MSTDTPQVIDQLVSSFCKDVVKDTSPLYVPVKAEEYALANECFHNVAKKVELDGGRVQYGWQVWIWDNILIEAEFHAVWSSENNELLDITPKDKATSKILFLPDNVNKYTGNSIDNIRKPIRKDKLIDNLILLARCQGKLTKQGRKDGVNLVSVNKEQYMRLTRLQGITLYMIENNLSRNSRCLCGSNKKYKHCHEKEIIVAANYLNVAS